MVLRSVQYLAFQKLPSNLIYHSNVHRSVLTQVYDFELRYGKMVRK